ncbi:MAG: hypothetical protein AAF602_21305 [Myxococcota bacterium]
MRHWTVGWMLAAAGAVPSEGRAADDVCASDVACDRELCIDREAFVAGFAAMHASRWPAFEPSTICAVNAILTFWETTTAVELMVAHPRRRRRNQRPEATAWPAYVLATALHETQGRVHPVREALCDDEACTVRALEAAFADGRIANRYWDPVEPGGPRYYGRGQVQLTHRDNYVKVDAALRAEGLLASRDLVSDPDVALDLDVSVAALVLGMVRGWFRRDRGEPASLSRYLSARRLRWRPRGAYRKARRIVNGDAKRRQAGQPIGRLLSGFAQALEPHIHFVAPEGRRPANAPAHRHRGGVSRSAPRR